MSLDSVKEIKKITSNFPTEKYLIPGGGGGRIDYKIAETVGEARKGDVFTDWELSAASPSEVQTQPTCCSRACGGECLSLRQNLSQAPREPEATGEPRKEWFTLFS